MTTTYEDAISALAHLRQWSAHDASPITTDTVILLEYLLYNLYNPTHCVCQRCAVIG